MRRRDYKKPLANLVSPRQKVQRRQSEKIKHYGQVFLFFLILIIIGGLIYLFLFSPIFQIKKIIISGTDKAEEVGEIENITKGLMAQKWFVFPQNNVFVFQTEGLKTLLKQKFELKNVVITKKRPHTIEIQLEKNKPVLIWRAGEKFFLMLNDGAVFKEITNLTEYELPQATSANTSTEIILGKAYAKSEQINFMTQVSSLLPTMIKNLKIKEFVVGDINSRDLKASTEYNWYILMSIDNEPGETLSNLKTAWDKIREEGVGSYIDLRIKDKIYYK